MTQLIGPHTWRQLPDAANNQGKRAVAQRARQFRLLHGSFTQPGNFLLQRGDQFIQIIFGIAWRDVLRTIPVNGLDLDDDGALNPRRVVG